jgi:transcription initiation factor TFIIIB Brf1 subunit/transcription initiation factor TFIIB
MQRHKRESLVNGLTVLDDLARSLDLGPTVEGRATELYRKSIAHGDILHGRGVKTSIAAAVVLASRESNDPREAREVAGHTADYISAKNIHRTTKLMRRELDLGLMLADPHIYVDQLADDLDSSADYRALTHEIVEYVLADGIASGRKAAAVAASSFYLVGKLDDQNGKHGRYTQREIANSTSVTTVTIRNSYPEFASVIAADPEDQFNVPKHVVDD